MSLTQWMIEAVGWSGAGFLLLAYYQNSRGKWPASGRLYQLVNFLAAGILAVYTGTQHAWPAAFLNSVWALLSLRFLLSMWRRVSP